MPTPDRLGEHRDERGIALLITMMVLFVVTIMTASVFADDISALPRAQHEASYLSALQAAESGVEDYINRLESSPSYWQHDAASPGSPANPAFTGWVAVPGGASDEYYTYAVNNSSTATTGTVYLISTGAAGPNKSVLRTIKVGLSEKGFTSFVYFTHYEIEDPTLTGLPSSGAGNACNYTASQYNPVASAAQGSAYYGPDMLGQWQATQVSYNGWSWAWEPVCSVGGVPEYVDFGSGDTLNGKVESDDEFHVCGNPAFPDGAYSSYDQSPSLDQAPTSANNYQGMTYGGVGAYYNSPVSGSAPSNYPPSGTTYNGHTYNGRYDRVSSTSFSIPACSDAPTGPGGAQWSASSGQPAGGALSFPTTNNDLSVDTTKNPADGNAGGCLYTGPITVVFNSSGTMSVTLAGSSSSVAYAPSGVKCTGSGVPLPPNGVLYDQDNSSSNCTPASSCLANVTVSGTVGGQVTVGSQANITIVGNLTDVSTTSTSDLLGLSANADVEIEHGTNCTENYGSWPAGCLANLTVDAAIWAGDSFYVQNWASGSPLGTLTVLGSIAQDYRGPVATSSNGTVVSGYVKSYNYDNRFSIVQPPYFTAPVNPPWVRESFAECQATPPASLTSSTC